MCVRVCVCVHTGDRSEIKYTKQRTTLPPELKKKSQRAERWKHNNAANQPLQTPAVSHMSRMQTLLSKLLVFVCVQQKKHLTGRMCATLRTATLLFPFSVASVPLCAFACISKYRICISCPTLCPVPAQDLSSW